MAEFLFQAHSGLRYLVLLAALVALVLLAKDRFGTRALSRGGRISSAIYTGLLDLQVLLGLILLLTWQWYGQLIGHIVMMVVALLAAHGFRVLSKRASEEVRRVQFLLTAVITSLALIIAGILAIQRGII